MVLAAGTENSTGSGENRVSKNLQKRIPASKFVPTNEQLSNIIEDSPFFFSCNSSEMLFRDADHSQDLERSYARTVNKYWLRARLKSGIYDGLRNIRVIWDRSFREALIPHSKRAGSQVAEKPDVVEPDPAFAVDYYVPPWLLYSFVLEAVDQMLGNITQETHKWTPECLSLVQFQSDLVVS